MKCPVKKCPMPTSDCRRKDQFLQWSSTCERAIARDLRRAQRLVREAEPAMKYLRTGYESWKRRAVEIGAMKESK